MNSRMYLLFIVAALIPPLGFVAGIPGSEHPDAFLAACFMLILLAFTQVWLFKRRGWI